VVPNQPGFDWNRIRALPGVEALTTFPAYTGLPTDVVRSSWYGDDVGGSGGLIPSPGSFARHRANFLGTAGDVPLNAIIRLRGGEADLPAFRADLARVTGRSTIDVFDLATLTRHYRSVTGFESAGLLAFGLAAFLAGPVQAGQAIARLVAAALTQATVFSVAGLLVGIPLGLAAGRTLWRVTAGIIPLYYQAPVACGTLLLVGPAVLTFVLLLALFPVTAQHDCTPALAARRITALVG
jgi:hypothetical protein